MSLHKEWRKLAVEASGNRFFCSPDWLIPWWNVYQHPLVAELYVLCVFDNNVLIGMAPLYRRKQSVGAGVKGFVLRLMGDAGPRGTSLQILSGVGKESVVGKALAGYLHENAGDWDALLWEPLRDPSKTRAYLASHLSSFGYSVRSQGAGGGSVVIALDTYESKDMIPDDDASNETTNSYDDSKKSFHLVISSTPEFLDSAVRALRRLSRLEWSDKDEQSPYAQKQVTHFFRSVYAGASNPQAFRASQVTTRSGEVVGVSLTVDTLQKSIVVAHAVDPDAKSSVRRWLLQNEAKQAKVRNKMFLEIAKGVEDIPATGLLGTTQRAISLQIFGKSKTAKVFRAMHSVKKRFSTVRGVPETTAAKARAAWAMIREVTAVGEVKQYQLFRGDLWTRGVVLPSQLSIESVDQAVLATFSERDCSDIVEHLQSTQDSWHTLLSSGNTAVVARLQSRLVGVAFASLTELMMPEPCIRPPLPGGQACVHGVVVAADARGSSIGSLMLEKLAEHLRSLDIYRSWAILPQGDDAPSRAFQKALYTPVADMLLDRSASGTATKEVVLRPPDAEAKRLLGLL